MHVTVTAGLGFIGSRLCGALLDEGSGTHAARTGAAAAPALAARGAQLMIGRAPIRGN